MYQRASLFNQTPHISSATVAIVRCWRNNYRGQLLCSATWKPNCLCIRAVEWWKVKERGNWNIRCCRGAITVIWEIPWRLSPGGGGGWCCDVDMSQWRRPLISKSQSPQISVGWVGVLGSLQGLLSFWKGRGDGAVLLPFATETLMFSKTSGPNSEHNKEHHHLGPLIPREA